jgi:hypothetical protein
MNNKIKTFWDKHKTKILIVGGATVVVGSYLIYKKFGVNVKNLKDNGTIIGKLDDGVFSLEKVKEILDLNKDVNSMYAIFREGPNLDEYVLVMLDDNVIV